MLNVLTTTKKREIDCIVSACFKKPFSKWSFNRMLNVFDRIIWGSIVFCIL